MFTSQLIRVTNVRLLLWSFPICRSVIPIPHLHPWFAFVQCNYRHLRLYPFTCVCVDAGTLLRVQDTSISPELYPSVLSDDSPGAWGLAESTVLIDSSLPDLQSLRQREVIWAVTVPGESPFISEVSPRDYGLFKATFKKLAINGDF